MLKNFDGYGHVKIGDFCRFSKPVESSFLCGQTCLTIKELYKETTWMVIAFDLYDECYVRSLGNNLTVKLPNYFVNAFLVRPRSADRPHKSQILQGKNEVPNSHKN